MKDNGSWQSGIDPGLRSFLSFGSSVIYGCVGNLAWRRGADKKHAEAYTASKVGDSEPGGAQSRVKDLIWRR